MKTLLVQLGNLYFLTKFWLLRFLSSNNNRNYWRGNKQPVLMLPGVWENWHALKPLSDFINRLGHPVYFIPKYDISNVSIEQAAKLVADFINQEKLENLVIIAHSKSGLVAKSVLSKFDDKIKKVIGIAVPFNGSKMSMFKSRLIDNISPGSDLIKQLNLTTSGNQKIYSLMSIYDGFVIPNDSPVVVGGHTYTVAVNGHYQILNSSKTEAIINELFHMD